MAEKTKTQQKLWDSLANYNPGARDHLYQQKLPEAEAKAAAKAANVATVPDTAPASAGQIKVVAPIDTPATGAERFPSGGPLGGYVNPTQTYTGHTDTKGKDEDKHGIGGGAAIAITPPSQNEMLRARPDLATSEAGALDVPQLAMADPSNFAPVQPIRNMSAPLRGQSLRAGALSRALRGG